MNDPARPEEQEHGSEFFSPENAESSHISAQENNAALSNPTTPLETPWSERPISSPSDSFNTIRLETGASENDEHKTIRLEEPLKDALETIKLDENSDTIHALQTVKPAGSEPAANVLETVKLPQSASPFYTNNEPTRSAVPAGYQPEGIPPAAAPGQTPPAYQSPRPPVRPAAYSGPSLQTACEKPIQVTVLSVLTLISGISNIGASAASSLAVVIGTLGIGLLCLPITILPAVLGIFEILYAINLLSSSPKPLKPNNTLAILEIIGILCGNVISLASGITALVVYNEPKVQAWFRHTQNSHPYAQP